MKLFRVTLNGDSYRYVLAEGFDTAAEAAGVERNSSIFGGVLSSEVTTVEDLGTPLQWTCAEPEEPEQLAPPTPAVSIRKSITPDYLVCLDDGKKLKTLKKHLAVLGMTPDAYRAKWGLPADYPMVAPNYSLRRSEMAKGIGLGKR